MFNSLMMQPQDGSFILSKGDLKKFEEDFAAMSRKAARRASASVPRIEHHTEPAGSSPDQEDKHV